MGSTFVALTADDLPRMYGYGNGVGHVILIPADAMGDPLSIGGIVETACGRSVDVGRLSEKFTGDRGCARCVKWLASDGGRNDVEAAREAKYARYADGPETGPELGGDVAPVKRDAEQLITFRVEGEPVSTEPNEAERAELAKRERARRAARKAVADNGTDTRETAAPVQGELFAGVTGLSHADMRAAIDRYYANGGEIPAEIQALPDPGVTRSAWEGTDAREGAVTPCDYKGDVQIINPEKTHGKCPECRAYIALQDVKSDPDAQRIGKHNRYGVANPPRPKILLSSESLGTVEHGSVPGSQADADRRRVAETRCGASGKMARGADGRARTTGGTYKCTHVIAENGTVCGRTVELDKRIRQTKKGKVTRWFIPNHTEGRDSFRSNGNGGYVAGERKVTPRGSGADAGKGQRDHGSVDGSANTGAQNMPPVRPGGWVGVAGTMSLPATVRPGVDPEVSGKWCPICEERPDVAHKGKGRSWWRNHGRRMAAYHKGREAEREAQRAEDVAAGRRLPAGARKAARKAVSVGSFAEGTVAGEVQHEGARPVLDARLKPYSKRTASPLERKILGGSKRRGGKGKRK